MGLISFLCFSIAVLESYSGYPTSNITFDADYDTFEKSDLLETKRAIIYNYLINIGMPITSDIILTKGLALSMNLNRSKNLFFDMFR